MSHKLVSVLTPCYNAERYIKALLDSILAQTYSHIEMIIIDDGSTDSSADIIKLYMPKFSKKGYKLRYYYQTNQGQSMAIKNGLKYVNGTYLVWPDADDYYAKPEAIAEMVAKLGASDDTTSMVRVQYNVLNEKGDITDRLSATGDTRYKIDLFEDAVFGNNGFWYPPGGYMAKMSKVDELIPGRNIYTEKNAGQNFQLYLPLLYGQKCLTIEEYLYNIVAHADSHSRDITTNNKRQKIYFRTIKNTLDNMYMIPEDYREYLIKRVKAITTAGQQTIRKHGYRTYTKRAIKASIPHGIVMLYKRKSQ